MLKVLQMLDGVFLAYRRPYNIQKNARVNFDSQPDFEQRQPIYFEMINLIAVIAIFGVNVPQDVVEMFKNLA